MNRTARTFCFLISILLLCYTITRAWMLPFTHDESYTYLYASRNSFMEIISNRTTYISANNHILNTLFVKLFSNTIGCSELVLRIQSIFAHAGYLLFSFLLLQRFRSAWFIVCAFIVLNVNPYLLDFFSLARGYAMSITFMMASIYYFSGYIREEKNKVLIYSLVAAGLAILANFSLLNFFFALLLIQQMVLFYRYKNARTQFAKTRISFIAFAVIVIICYEPVRKLIKYNALEFGGQDGIWKNTVGSQIAAYTYGKTYDYAVMQLMYCLVVLSLLLFVFLILRGLYRRNISSEEKEMTLIFSILFLILFFNSVQHFVFGTPYLNDRFALFLSPLYLLFAIHLLYSLAGNGKLVGLAQIISVSLPVIMSIHFFNCMNLQYAVNWKYDASTKEMLKDLKKEKELLGKQKISLGITWWFEPGINFYRETQHLDWLEPVTRNGIAGEFDFYYVMDEDLNSVPAAKRMIRKYPGAESILLTH